jgi:hypothetical protein
MTSFYNDMYYHYIWRNRNVWTNLTKSVIRIETKKEVHQQIGLEFEEETSKMLHLEHGFVWC